MFLRSIFLVLTLSVFAGCASAAPNPEASPSYPTVEPALTSTAPPSTTPAPTLCPDFADEEPVALPVGVVQELADEGKDHHLCSSYTRTPPASGDHFPAWQNCGIYNAPIPNQTAVHSLEHGAVWVAYQPSLSDAELQSITNDLRNEVFALVAPYPGLQNPIVLTAWTRQLAVNTWSDPAVEEFLNTYLGRSSPVAPEAGASCVNGVGLAPYDPNYNYQEIYDRISGALST